MAALEHRLDNIDRELAAIKEQLVRLIGGEEKRPTVQPCLLCQGTGKKETFYGSRDRGQTVDCPPCRGTGNVLR